MAYGGAKSIRRIVRLWYGFKIQQKPYHLLHLGFICVSVAGNGKLYLHSLIKLILFPVAVCLLAKLCGLQQSYILLATAMAGMPSAATVTMLAELYEIEPGYASQTVGITSLLSTASLPLVMLFAQWISAL